jgi:hypothetical protein
MPTRRRPDDAKTYVWHWAAARIRTLRQVIKNRRFHEAMKKIFKDELDHDRQRE